MWNELLIGFVFVVVSTLLYAPLVYFLMVKLSRIREKFRELAHNKKADPDFAQRLGVVTAGQRTAFGVVDDVLVQLTPAERSWLGSDRESLLRMILEA